MEYSTTLTFKKAILLDGSFFREIEKVILTFCSDVHYSVDLENRDSIKFESLEEMLDFENSKINKVKRIEIDSGYVDLPKRIRVIISCDSVGLLSGRETASVFMVTDNVANKNAFKQEIENIFLRYEQKRGYDFLSRLRMFSYLEFAYVFVAVVYFCSWLVNDFQNISKESLSFIFIFFVLYLLKTPFGWLQRKYYPQVVFYFGDEIRNYDEMKNGRKNFFWGGIIAALFALLSLLGSCVLPILT